MATIIVPCIHMHTASFLLTSLNVKSAQLLLSWDRYLIFSMWACLFARIDWSTASWSLWALSIALWQKTSGVAAHGTPCLPMASSGTLKVVLIVVMVNNIATWTVNNKCSWILEWWLQMVTTRTRISTQHHLPVALPTAVRWTHQHLL